MTVLVGEHELTFETGKIARQAGGSIFLSCGDTRILATACSSPAKSEETDFLPMRVDYQEKFSSVGRTLAGFIKREGRPTERETLVCRLIDRPLRPLFPDGYYDDLQVLSYVYSFDGIHTTDVLAICAASAALMISDIPFTKPVGAVRVGMIDGKFVLNPSSTQMKESTLDLVLAGTEDAILMIEGYCDFLTEEQIMEAIETGHIAIQAICKSVREWAAEVGKEKNTDTINHLSDEVVQAVEKAVDAEMNTAIRIAGKQERDDALSEIKEKMLQTLLPEGEEPKFLKRDIMRAYKKIQAGRLRSMVLSEKKRVDGRKLDQVRAIDVETELLPRTHGSALFTRGETQAFAVCTLGGETMAQRYEDLHEEGTHRFYMQYFFPPFSVGEVGRMGPPARREVGHGKLAERSLKTILPKQEDFPYIIRLESNITESNGSSSMASVCGGCLAMMGAGVPIERPVAGIAMGLILEKDDHAILSDILGAEDALGDMDFKIAGDEKGVTAFQMDIKVEGITKEIMKAALAQAKDGRVHILQKMLEALPKSKEKLSVYAPRIEMIQVKPSQIGTIIGPGGKQIRAIVEETGVQVDINDDGIVSLASSDLESIEKAKEIIHYLTAEIEIGKVYNGKIKSIVPFGMFVEVAAGKEGLCHISEVAHRRVENLHDLFKIGDMLEVKVLDINDRGQIKLSHKVLLSEPANS